MPVLLRVFPQGLDSRDPQQAARLRDAYEDWLERGAKQPSVHQAWIRHVLHDLLGYPAGWLAEGQAVPAGIQAVMANVGEVLRPDIVLKHGDADGKSILLVALYPPEQDLEKPVSGKLWKATAGTRMMELLHAADLPLGLITNGEEWTLVSGPRGETTGFSAWYADLWMQEPLTLRAFHSLLHLRRLVGVAQPDTLPALFIESSKDQQEVTDQLGYQVRQAVEVLVQAFDRIDAESGRTLLSDVGEKALYESSLTVMMRLVFLFSAEERGLLLLGDPLYDQNYAVSTLSALLREQADQHGEEVLERRHDAWCRLLSTFRAVHGGVEHEAMRLPPYGGALFDPDRYPFLEGRAGNSSWRGNPAIPLLINNRVVLHLLEALQVLRVSVPGGGSAEARRLSFRALDIEQIGHVYEGLLDHTAKRAVEPVLGLVGSKDKEPEIPLATLEEIARQGTVALVEFLRDETGRSERALRRLIEEPPASDDHSLLIACGQDERLVFRVKPFAPFLREDSFGQLVVVPPGSVYVTAGSDRRSTGTHYTPRSLTEPIVRHTLEPLVYVGPADGLPEAEWTLKNPKEILALKVCDMAMGSGAFLVESCRYLGERLVEAWENVERVHPGSFVVTPDGVLSSGNPTERLIPADAAERVAIARRFVADRCLYGVDINSMAVEMAKVSLWLITLQRDRPFSFVDHAFKRGDSLLGVSSLAQIENFSLRNDVRQITFDTAELSRQVEEASRKRLALEALPSSDLGQIETKSRLNAESEASTRTVKLVADALIAFELNGFEGNAYLEQRTAAAAQVDAVVRRSSQPPQADTQRELDNRCPFHWPLEFAEVFQEGGFDAFIGNPPFMGGRYISGTLGTDYLGYLKSALADGVKGNCDLVAYFYLRACSLLRSSGYAGYIGTKTITEGDTFEVGLLQFDKLGADIIRAETTLRWPGGAAVIYSTLHWSRSHWSGARVLNGTSVDYIGPRLDGERKRDTYALEQRILPYQGSYIHGDGFLLTATQRQAIVTADPASERCIFPCLTGDDFNTSPSLSSDRFAIYLGDLSEFEAKRFRGAWEHIEREVKPQRLAYVGTPLATYWWRYKRPTKPLYEEIWQRPTLLACAVVTKYLALAWIPSRVVLMNKIYAFLHAAAGDFTVLQSSHYDLWVRQFSANLGETLQFAPTDCFVNFPLPLETAPLAEVGSRYHEFRSQVMQARGEGLTQTYNRFHDRMDKSADIGQLRTLQVEMDQAVALAYGWDDLKMNHGFRDTKQGERYTLTDLARREVFDRLVTLNQQRHETEISAGAQRNAGRKTRRGRAKAAAPDNSGLFGS
jgi:Eco57I restriction-modification methylase/restriction-modification enzyme MmeI-like protein